MGIELEKLYTSAESYETACLVYDVLDADQRSAVDTLRLVRQLLVDTSNDNTALDCVLVNDILIERGVKQIYIDSCISLLEHIFEDQPKFCFDDIEKQELQQSILSLTGL